MRAKSVNENIEFQRSNGPKKSLEIGFFGKVYDFDESCDGEAFMVRNLHKILGLSSIPSDIIKTDFINKHGELIDTLPNFNKKYFSLIKKFKNENITIEGQKPGPMFLIDVKDYITKKLNI